MFNETSVLLLLAIPVAAAFLVSLNPGKESGIPKALALVAMLVTLGLSAGMFFDYQGAADIARYNLNLSWIDSLGVNFHLGLDGLNLYLVLLTGLLPPVVLLCAWGAKESNSKLFVSLLLLGQASLFGTFLSQNIMLFFAFWEMVLIPMFVLILVYGGDQKKKAAMTFFLYTMAGSILLLAAIILLGVESLHQTGSWSFEMATLQSLHLDAGTQYFVFGAIALACAVKCPIFPFHSWLPLAYKEAPSSGTALMAGAMSKMGAFALLKLAIPLCPIAAAAAGPFIVLLAVISIVYGAVLALKQEDFKKLVAYSSLSHMGYIVLGIFTFNAAAVHGAMFQILSHGIAVVGLFLMLGLLEQRMGASYLKLNALGTIAPRLAVMLMLFILCSVALPLTSGFTSEFLILFGGFQAGMATAQAGGSAVVLVSILVACTGMVLGAGYMLRFARAILYGQANEAIKLEDLSVREAVAFLPLIALILWIGVAPAGLMNKTQGAIEQLNAQVAGAAAQPVAAINTSVNGGK